MSVDIILKDIEWDGVNKIRVPLEGGGTQDFSIGGGSANLQTKSKTYTPTASQQTDTVSPDSGYDGLSSVNVTVNAMPSGSAGTPTATKGTVSNHSVSVTPSVTNTTGYITGGTKTGTSVSVSASELVSGSQTVAGNGTFDVTNLAQLIVDTPTMNLPSATSSTPTGTNKANILPSTSQRYLNIPAGLNDTARYYQIIGMDLAPLNVTQNGTYNASDVDITGFNTVTVNVPTGGASLQTKSATYTPTTSQQTDTITPDTGYDGMDEVDITINAVPTGSVTMPSSISADEGSAHYTTQARLIITASGTATPDVTQAGYISSGTSGSVNLLVATTIPTKDTATFYPSTTDRTIPSNYYIKGAQTIKAVTTNNIIASNIKQGVTVEVGDADDPDRILSVTGTLSGGASNLVTGTFTTGSSEGYTNISTGYTGNGYPIACMVFVEGGAYVSGTTWYTTIQRYAVGFWSMSKANQSTTPSYTTSGSRNQGVITAIYKSSTSSSTSYSRTSAMTTNVFSSNNASNSAANTIKLKSGNVLSYYTNTSSYGLMPNITYRYFIVYSE